MKLALAQCPVSFASEPKPCSPHTHTHARVLSQCVGYLTILHGQLPLPGSLTLSHSHSAHPPAEGNDSSSDSIGLGCCCCSSPSVAIDISPRVIPLSTGSLSAAATAALLLPAPGSARLADGFSVISAVLVLVSTSLCNKTGQQNLPSARLCVSQCVCVCDCDCVSLCCFVHAVTCRVVRYVVVLQLSTESSSSSLPHSVANVSSSTASQQRRGVVVCCACRGRIYKFFAYFHFSFNFFVFFFRFALPACASSSISRVRSSHTIALGWLPFEY